MTNQEKVTKQWKENLIKIGLFMEQSMGFPSEIYLDMVNKMTFDDKMRLMFGFYKDKKKYCNKNGIVVDYNEIIK